MNISKEHFARLINQCRETIKRSNRSTAAVMMILKIFGLVFVAGAVIIIFSLPVGVLVCAAAAVLFVALYYLEIHAENKNQLELYHMILSKSSFGAVSEYLSEGCTDKAVSQLEAVLDTEADPKRKAILGSYISEAHILRGEKYVPAPIDEPLCEEDSFFKLMSLCHSMRSDILSEDSASFTCTITAAYDEITKLVNNDISSEIDPMTAMLIIKTEILTAFFKEDYFRCVEYIDTLLVCPDIFSCGRTDDIQSPAAYGYTLLKIRCLYYIGKYDKARRLCEDIMPKLTYFGHLHEQAKELWELLN